MKILITGGAGFIGSHLAEALLKENNRVLVIDNYQTGRRDNLKSHKNLKLIETTIVDKKDVDKIFKQFTPDIVIHAAASYKDPNNWIEDAMTNIIGTINVVNACKFVGVKKLIYFQTSLCYGIKPIQQPITLTHPFFAGKYSGGSSYAISKTAGEMYIELSGLEFISFRLANAYGPRNLSGPVPTFYNRLTNDLPCIIADSRRDFIFIRDLVQVVMKAVHGQGKKGYYHVSSGKDYSIKELFDAVVKAMGMKLKQKIPVKPRGADDAPTILIDPSKTNKEFKWKTSTLLQNGVAEAVAWYKSHKINETYTHLRIEKK